jgi:hypothetical protein
VQFCELLPRVARMADRLAVVRSLWTNDNNHDSSGFWLLTGYKYVGPNSRTIQPTDWPYFGSLVKKLKPSDALPPLSTVWIPDRMRLNENVTPAGQTAGFLGSQWNPDTFVGDPSASNYQVQGLDLATVPPLRLRQRDGLRQQLERHFATVERGPAVQSYDRFQQQALDLISSGRAREAFDLHKEPDKIRERYGRGQWASCLILARRLIEAGVRLVHVGWPREAGDNAVDNPMWDTHARNADRLEDVLCPQFDVGFTALLEDLQQRGLLAETLVVCIGEFGRTPKINANGGRDHWGHVFSFALAGAGVSGGQVYGASDATGSYPARDPVSGGDLTATLFHLLGIDYRGTFHDREGRIHKLTEGTPVYRLLGTEPATTRRVAATGDLARVPPYDDRLLTYNGFDHEVPLRPIDQGPRPLGWRATPILSGGQVGIGVRLSEQKQAMLGFATGEAAIEIAAGQAALLAQEVRSPFAGKFRLSLRCCGGGTSQELYEEVLLKQFICRLMFYQYTKASKNPLERKELASLTVQPKFRDRESTDWETFVLEKTFENPNPGQNFSFGLGMGVGLILEKSSPGPLRLVPGAEGFCWIRVQAIELEFAGKPIKEEVTV